MFCDWKQFCSRDDSSQQTCPKRGGATTTGYVDPYNPSQYGACLITSLV